MKSLKLIMFFLAVSSVAVAQSEVILNQQSISGIKIPRINLGGEIQAHAVGATLGARADLYLGKHVNWNFRLSYNLLNNKKDNNINAEEKGGGFGVALGYRYFLDKREGLFVGGRADFRKMTIDWTSAVPLTSPTIGVSEVSIFQPSVEVGYLFKINKHWTVAPALSSGFNLNMITKGAKVDSGFIAQIGINAAYKILKS